MDTHVSDKELSALLQLLEDPDEAVYEPVSKRILEYGREVIPHLEHTWETSEQTEQQARIESIIRRIHFLDTSRQFDSWRGQSEPDLFEGLLILDQLHSREDRADSIRQSLELLRRNAWLELNQYLTPLEQVHVLSRVVFEHERFKGVDAAREQIQHLFPGDILLKKTGNQLGLLVLIQVLAEKLDLPLYALAIPGIFVLGSPNLIRSNTKTGIDSIDFYLDPQTGELFGRTEIEQFLRRTHQPIEDDYFQPLTSLQLVNRWLGRVAEKATEIEDHHLAMQATELLRQS
ncbi:MAG: transglutaminase family protein [Bacteroidota bacterium]